MLLFSHISLLTCVLIACVHAGINDGRCGPNFESYGCPRDFCCSKFQYCGNTPNHCNDRLSPFTRSDGRCGPHYDKAPCPIGSCCSKSGQCGTGILFCNSPNNGTNGPSSSFQRLLSSVTSTSITPQTSTPYIRSDSRCGAPFGNAVCRTGHCCSTFNYCGSGPDYCSTAAPVPASSPVPSSASSLSSPAPSPSQLPSSASSLSSPAPSPSQLSSLAPSPSAPTAIRCGAPYGDAVCPQGQCCSKWNYCGSGPDYCPAPTPAPSSPPQTQPPTIRSDNRCGALFGNAGCPQGQCCSQYNYCGSGPDYCFTSSLTTLLPKSLYDSLVTKDPSCEGPPKYTYENFLRAASAFPTFANQGSLEAQKRDIVGFLSHVLHESGDLCYINEIAHSTPATYCAPSDRYPCYPGANYHGRGPFQLTWNFNYIKFGQTLTPDLALAIYQTPDALSNDGELLFRTAFWYYMLAQPTGSMHDNMIANPPNFAQTIRNINGPVECNGGNPAQVNSRVKRYQALCNLFGIDPGTTSLYC